MGEKSLTAKDAAKVAARYYQDVSGNYSQPTIEEVELSDDGKFWLITLGVEKKGNNALGNLYGNITIQYKVFEISNVDGEVKSMKIRKDE